MTRDLTGLIFLVPILLLSMMAHEVAHGYVAYRLGDPTARYYGRLSINPLRHLDPVGTAMFIITYLFGGFVFGWAKPVPVNPHFFRDRQRGMMLVGLAGPVANFLVAVVIGLLLNLVHPGVASLLFRVLSLAFQVNVVLGMFNLIPIPPLDGSRVIAGFMPPHIYAKWATLDSYGMIFILLIFVLFRGAFFTIISGAYHAISRLLLWSYF